MAKEVTVITKTGTFVALGELGEDGRLYYHVKVHHVGVRLVVPYIANFAKVDVKLLEGYRYDLVFDAVEQTKAILNWEMDRQAATVSIRTTAQAKIDRQVALAVKRWEREHPMPTPTPTPTPEAPLDSYIAAGPEAGTSTAHASNSTEDVWPNFPESKPDIQQPDTIDPLESARVTVWTPTVGEPVIVKDTWETGVVQSIANQGTRCYVRLDDNQAEPLFDITEIEPQIEL
jgi:hypothetical protein